MDARIMDGAGLDDVSTLLKDILDDDDVSEIDLGWTRTISNDGWGDPRDVVYLPKVRVKRDNNDSQIDLNDMVQAWVQQKD